MVEAVVVQLATGSVTVTWYVPLLAAVAPAMVNDEPVWPGMILPLKRHTNCQLAKSVALVISICIVPPVQVVLEVFEICTVLPAPAQNGQMGKVFSV